MRHKIKLPVTSLYYRAFTQFIGRENHRQQYIYTKNGNNLPNSLFTQKNRQLSSTIGTF